MKLDQILGVLLILLAIYLAVNASGGPPSASLDFFGGDTTGGAQSTTGGGRSPASGAGTGGKVTGGHARTAGRERVVANSELCATVPNRSQFTDLGRAHDAAIRCMVYAEIMSGVSRTRFAPSEPITRAQTADAIVAMIDEANRLEAPGVDLRSVPAADGTQFRDVDDRSPHRRAIQRLDRTPILQGYVDLRFEPRGTVTRGQMASILDRTYRYMTDAGLPTGQDRFRDDERSVHEDSINAVASAGIMPGVGDGRFAPHQSVRRGQMASYLARMMVRMEEKGRIRPLP